MDQGFNEKYVFFRFIEYIRPFVSKKKLCDVFLEVFGLIFYLVDYLKSPALVLAKKFWKITLY